MQDCALWLKRPVMKWWKYTELIGKQKILLSVETSIRERIGENE